MNDDTLSLDFCPKHRQARNIRQRTAAPPSAVKGACWIPLSQNDFALVDSCDFYRVSEWLWSTLARKGRSSYAMRRANDCTIYLHRFIMNAPAGMDVDHIDGDGLNCRRANLRVCTHAENQRNYRKCSKPTLSKHKGVRWDKQAQKWKATIKLDRKSRHLGSHKTEEEAARAYDAAALRLFGEFARLNFPCK